jgi:coenzyme F420-0:L-glutamate ligase/coenzyme F420-1:gamma-L-glutamate ligase
VSGVQLIGLEGIPEVQPGDDLAELIRAALAAADIGLEGDVVLVVTQKIVSKAEGRVVELSSVEPSELARDWARRWGKDARQVELVLRESASIVRMADGGLIISRTRHGLVCANAGVDLSNVGAGDVATLLPEDPDGSARALCQSLGVPVIISDSFGRPWRNGIVNVAIGVAGLQGLIDLRGQPDASGRVMRSTIIAVADELASAADLAGGKVTQRPVVLVRGFGWQQGDDGARSLVMDRGHDLFP